MIIGPGGSGKSTLAGRLGQQLGLPVIHLDQLYFGPNWTPAPREEWHRIHSELVSRGSWIMDGNLNQGGTLDGRIRAADTIVFLDMPRLLCVWRVLKRYLQNRGRTRPDMAQGCPERLNWEFARWIWSAPSRRPATLRRLSSASPGKTVVHLRSPRQVRSFLRKVARAGVGG